MPQLQLTNADREDFIRRIELDWRLDSQDMEKRNRAYKRWYRLWRAVREMGSFPSEEVSNFHIPMIQWQVLAKLSKEIDALLGDDSEVIVRGIGPSDQELAPKISKYMNWRLKISLKIFKKLYDYLLQKDVLGTSIAQIPWIRRTRKVKKLIDVPDYQDQTTIDPATQLPMLQRVQTGSHKKEVERDVVDYEGPDVIVEAIEDWAFPAHAKDINTADHFERRLRLTVDELLDMADDGKLDPKQLKGEPLEKLRRFAETGNASPATETDSGKQMRDEKSEQSGVPQEGAVQGRDERLTVINWNGKFRRKSAKADERAEEVVAFWQPETRILLGASRLVDIFPDGRRGFIKSELIRDVGGSIWGIGLPELLESINAEMDVQHNALTDASVYALGPLIVYEPASGFNPTSFKYEPFTTLPVADANKVKALNLANVNLAPYIALQPQLLGYAERISGLTEAELGRPFAQSNAPRTLGQQQILSAGSGVRLLLDLRLERESLRELLNRIWDLDRRFLPKPIWFRVTESEEMEQLTEQDMEGNFDFDIGPLSGTVNKGEEVARLLQAYALALQNPVAAQNPVLLAGYLRKINSRMGLEDLNAFIPDMSQMAPPKSPEEENAMMARGTDVNPSPMDNHAQHIAKHTDFRNRMEQIEITPGVTMAVLTPGLLGNIDSHIAEHQAAMKGTAQGIMMPAKSNGQGGPALPTASDTTGTPNDALNSLKSVLNLGGLNLG